MQGTTENEALLQARLAELEAVYRIMPAGMAVLDDELRYVRVNETLAQMNGIPVADHIGRTIHEVVPEVAATAEPFFRRLFETGEAVYDLEVDGDTPGSRGKNRTWLENVVPLLD